MNAVIYARYSSHNQTEQSIEGQLHDNYEYAARENITVIGEYIDRAVSGRTDNRDDFQRMIADAAKRQFSLVIVWKLDRFARNRYDSAINKAKLKKCGVRVISVKESITDTPEGIILEGMLESMAEYYSANLSVNVKRGQRETIAKGKYCGGHIPYGYKSVDGKLVADERTAHIIRYVFEQYASGVPKREIINELSRRGVKSATGRPLTITSFQSALVNTIYVGKLIRNGQEVPGCAEPLIDQATFDAAQKRLAINRRAPAASKAIVDYLLQGKVFCGHCGSSMAGESGKGKKGVVYHYYKCSNRKKNRGCKKKNEKKDILEWYVVEQTVQYVLTPSNIEKIAKAVVAEYENEFSAKRVTELTIALKQIEIDLEKLLDTLLDAPKAAHPRIYAKMESLEAQKADLKNDIAKQKIAMGIRYTEEEVSAWMRVFCNGDLMDAAFRRRIIDVFINSIYVYDNRIAIFYNIKGGKQVSYTDLKDSLDPDPSSAPSECSDMNAHALPSHYKSEPAYVFVNGVFGCVFWRD